VTLRLEASDPSSCPAVVDFVDIVINRASTVEAGANRTICEGSNVKLNGSIGGAATSALWSTTGDGDFSFEGDLSATYMPGTSDIANGMVKLYLTANDPDGAGPSGPCDESVDSLTITINPIATVNAGTDFTVCENETINLDGSIGGSASTSTWSGGAGMFDDINDPQSGYTPAASEISAGWVTLTLSTDDPDGGGGPCMVQNDQVTVSINRLPTVNAGIDRRICETSNVKLSGSIGGTATSATWSTSGDGTFSFNGDLNATYFPGSNDKASNSAILTLTTDDPSGPCPAANDQLTLQIDTRAIALPGSYSDVCIGDSVYLNGNIAGSATSVNWTGGSGVYENPGQLDAVYVPAQEEAGSNVTLTMTTDDPEGPCSADIQQTVVGVNQLPLVNFTGLEASYQEDDENEQLTGFPDNSGTFSGPGMISNIFRPSVAGEGSHTITYEYTDANGCMNSNSKETTVFPLESIVVTIDEEVCINDPIQILIADPPGGTWSGPGVFQETNGIYKFNPAQAGTGNHVLTYTFIDENNTVTTEDVTVVVHVIPNVDFTIENSCISDVIEFTDMSTISDEVDDDEAIIGWNWNFGDQTEAVTSQNASHQYDSARTYLMSLVVNSRNECSAFKDTLLKIGSIPVPDFSVRDIAFGDDTEFEQSTAFPKEATQISNVETVRWDLDDGTIMEGGVAGFSMVTHQYLDSGLFDVNLRITTDLGCVNDTTRTISILPQISSYPYFQPFEAPNGWISEGRRSSWELGTPAGETINAAYSGSRSWVTNLDGTYDSLEQSFVLGPSFDLRSLDRPMLSLSTWSHTQEGFDGAAIQFSLDGGINWENLGNVDDQIGLNWYNEKGIVGGAPGEEFNPGGNGWSGTNGAWVVSRRSLDDLLDLWSHGGASDLSSVRFRVAFGSNQDNPTGITLDGFAFDDFWVGNRTRNVLVEHFSNLNNSNAMAVNEDVYQIMDDQPRDGVLLQYHLSHPVPDDIFRDNVNPPNSRGSVYDLNAVPVTIFDGQERFELPTPVVNKPDFINRSLTDPQCEISISYTELSTPHEIGIEVEVTSRTDSTGPSALYIVPVEKVVTAFGGTTLRSIVKAMVPNPGGIPFQFNENGAVRQFSRTWNLNQLQLYDSTELAVVAFVQRVNAGTNKRVLQSAMIDLPILYPQAVITSLEDELAGMKGNKMTIYPNPAIHRINVNFDLMLDQKLSWKLTDLKGKTVKTGAFDAGVDQFSVPVDDVPDGMHFLSLTDGEGGYLIRKIVIKH